MFFLKIPEISYSLSFFRFRLFPVSSLYKKKKTAVQSTDGLSYTVTTNIYPAYCAN